MFRCPRADRRSQMEGGGNPCYEDHGDSWGSFSQQVKFSPVQRATTRLIPPLQQVLNKARTCGRPLYSAKVHPVRALIYTCVLQLMFSNLSLRWFDKLHTHTSQPDSRRPTAQSSTSNSLCIPSLWHRFHYARHYRHYSLKSLHGMVMYLWPHTHSHESWKARPMSSTAYI